MATLKLNNVRLAFPHVFAPKATDDGEPKYSVTLLLPPDHPQLPEVAAAIKAVAVDKWGAKAQLQLTQLKAAGKLPVHDGAEKSQYTGFEGNVYINCSSKLPPLVLGTDRRPVDQASGLIYPGVFANVIVDIWAQDNSYGKRINAGFTGVQFARHGEELAGPRRATVDDFDDISGEAEVPAPAPQGMGGFADLL
jgi:hypothetical protein